MVYYLKGRPDWVQHLPVATTSATSVTPVSRSKYQPCLCLRPILTLHLQYLRHLHLILQITRSILITSLLVGNADVVTTSSTLSLRKTKESTLGRNFISRKINQLFLKRASKNTSSIGCSKRFQSDFEDSDRYQSAVQSDFEAISKIQSGMCVAELVVDRREQDFDRSLRSDSAIDNVVDEWIE
ncbi:unnamed protein product [Camellia sinensis]